MGMTWLKWLDRREPADGHGALTLAGAALALMALTGCDQLGIDTPAKVEERLVAESKAIGGACRHAMRAIEDCYAMNPKAQKAAIAGGWREMDEYMRENKLEGVTPTIAKVLPKKAHASDDAEEEVDAESGSTSASDSAASKSQGETAKTDNPPATADKADKAEHGADSKSKREKRDTLHAEAASSKPH